MGLGTGATAAIIGGIGAAGSVASSAIQKNSADSALDLQKQAYDTQQQNAAPYLSLGATAAGDLQSQIGDLTKGFSFTNDDFTSSPGYQFALQQGQQAIERSAAAKGGALSGGALKDIAAYTTGMADQDYANAYNRAYTTFNSNQGNAFNRLAALANMGLSANGQSNQSAQNYANTSGDYNIQAGNAAASGVAGATNSLSSSLTNALNNSNNAQILGGLLNGSTFGSGSSSSPYVFSGLSPTSGLRDPSFYAF